MPDKTVEELASLCLERLQSEGDKAIDEICAQHPEHADEIRGMVQQLLKFGLVEESSPEDSRRSFGDFHKLEKIGRGGMGVVYAAEQISLRRKVALKLMRPGFFEETKAKERFRREVEAISKIDHPGICTVYEAGEFDGTPYLAMRFVEGESLADSIARTREEGTSAHVTSVTGSGAIGETLAMIEKVARALHAAHEAGVMHRDVKPGNVIVESGGEPVIVDFGLARAADGASHSLTASGEQIGTPAYMAPEQVAGTAVDRRADVYGLGVTLYECLTLRPPFASDSRESLYRLILTQDPPDPRRTNRSIGTELKIVLEKALAKEPADRFQTALDFAEELRRIRVHEPIRTRRPNLFVRTLRWSQRNRTASGVMVATTLGLVVSLWFLRRSQLEEKHRHALNFTATASELVGQDPVLAFKLVREAFYMQSDDPIIKGQVRVVMGRLRGYEEVVHAGHEVQRVVYSPDGKFLYLGGGGYAGALYRTSDGQQVLADLPFSYIQNPAVAFSRDGEFAIGSRDSKVYRYDLRQSPPKEIAPLPGNVNGIHFIAYSPVVAQRQLLVVHGGNRAAIWTIPDDADAAATRKVLTPSDPKLLWTRGAALPNGHFVACGGVWDADCEPVCRELPGLGEATESNLLAAIAVSDRHFLVAPMRGGLRLYDHSGKLVWKKKLRAPPPRENVVHAEFGPSGNLILVHTKDGRIFLLDAESGIAKEQWHFNPPNRSVLCARLSPDGKRVAAGNWGGLIKLFDLHGKELDELAGHKGGITWLAFAPDGKSLTSSSWEGQVRTWTMRPLIGNPIMTGLGWPSLAVSRSGDRVAVGSETGRHYVCDAKGSVIASTPHDSRGLIGTGIDYDGYTAVFCDMQGRIRLWDTRHPDRMPEVLRSPIPIQPRSAERLADRETWLFITWPRNRLYTWRPDGNGNGAPEKFELVSRSGEKPEVAGITGFDVSRDGTRVVISTWGPRLWVATERGEVLWQTEPGDSLFEFVSFAEDEQWILAPSGDNYAHLFNWQTGEHRKYGPHRNGVMRMLLSPDGKRVITGARDGYIRAWDRQTGEKLLELLAHEPGLRSLVSTATGHLVSGGADGVVRWWDPEAELGEAVGRIPIGPLTDAERKRFPELFGK